MAGDERLYTVPLRGKWIKKTRVLRTKKAVNCVKDFISRHTKASDVRISTKLNELLWTGGAKRPPNRVKVKVKVENSTAWARLPNEVEVKPEKEEKSKLESLKERAQGKGAPKTEKEESTKEKAQKMISDMKSAKKGSKKSKKKSDETEKSSSKKSGTSKK